ncbi:WD40-repeat-containing domain protein [Suillus bovinus]|uniref:WD40-repeat-containing domain protein n=1 Tax=Suillus bovinus TaxID=48563 RepID=UPI001B86F6D4|nr:WD40-repeat-containing domain protein [Suillus bovinus]KAG2129049.1 WD40-repeat-containing domain protein [Suillus bovinus]
MLGHTSVVTSVSFSPDGTRIVTGSWDNTVRLWDTITQKPVGPPLLGHTNYVTSVSFSPDGARIVTASRDNTVRLWDAATRLPLGEPLRGHTSATSSASFSPDGTRIVTSSWDSTVRLWDAVVEKPLQQCVKSGHTMSPDEYRVHPIEATTMTPSTQNKQLIRFSSNSTHALCNTDEMVQAASHDDHSSTTFDLNHDSGWVVGLNRRLLFWVPPASRHAFYCPRTALVVPRGGPEIDLSRMAHGQHWRKCREE